MTHPSNEGLTENLNFYNVLLPVPISGNLSLMGFFIVPLAAFQKIKILFKTTF